MDSCGGGGGGGGGAHQVSTQTGEKLKLRECEPINK